MTDFPAYNCVMADPPWNHESWRAGVGNGLASSHYELMSTADVAALSPFLDRVTAPRCVLFLWVTQAMLDDGRAVMASWGFTYKTIAFVWVKLSEAPLRGAAWRRAQAEGREIVPYKSEPYLLAFGNGHYTRAGAEICLLGTRGGGHRPESKAERQVILAPRRRHSAKPLEAYERIEAMYPTYHRLELFARTPRRGWAGWGKELQQQRGESA